MKNKKYAVNIKEVYEYLIEVCAETKVEALDKAIGIYDNPEINNHTFIADANSHIDTCFLVIDL